MVARRRPESKRAKSGKMGHTALVQSALFREGSGRMWFSHFSLGDGMCGERSDWNRTDFRGRFASIAPPVMNVRTRSWLAMVQR